MNKNNLYKNIVLSVAMVAFGIFILVDPNLMDDVDATGRNALLKQVLVLIWGIPGGLVLLIVGGLIGGLTGYKIFNKKPEPSNQESSSERPKNWQRIGR